MTQSLIPFQFDTGAIRVVDIDGQPWFVARDVTSALGYSNAKSAIDDNCKGIARSYPLSTTGGVQDVRLISEGDVMRLIVRSKLPAAQRFERWVFDDVLPAIRKTGRYAAPQLPALPQTYSEALRALADEHEKTLGLEREVAEQAPMVAALERIADAQGAMNLRAAAKTLQVAPQRFVEWLARIGWIFRGGHNAWHAYQAHINAGHMVQKVTTRSSNIEGEQDFVFEQALVTAKGLATLAKRLESPRKARSSDKVARESIEKIPQAIR